MAEGDNGGNKRKAQVKELVRDPWTKTTGARGRIESGSWWVGRAEESNGGERETTVIE